MSDRRLTEIIVTGYGAVTCAGPTSQELWTSVLDGTSHVREGLGRAVPHLQDTKIPLLGDSVLNSSAALRFSLQAARECLAMANWSSLNSDDLIILGTTTGQVTLWDRALVDYENQKIGLAEFEKYFQYQPMGLLIEALSQNLKGTGPRLIVTSACSASTQALAIAANWLKQGRAHRALVGGVEVLCPLTVEGFRSLKLLAPNPCRPFDQERNGINLSEGSAFLALELDQPKLKPRAYFSGAGLSTDAHHMTGPHPEGRGSFEAMTAALLDAKLKPEHIDFIHAHGTGSQQNDASESIAIKKCFGNTVPPVASTKSIHGHSLGASGAIEAILCIRALETQQILGTPGLEQLDGAIQIPVQRKNETKAVTHILKNSLGFGGMNASVVFSKVTAR